ncbi:MAG: FRG domain-containing protein [Sedimentisphaerales bacterium]|nr:FRG domain-containing protein [Sedimentisphaerales bacterium]
MGQECKEIEKQIKEGCLVNELDSWENFLDFVKDESQCWPTLIFRGQANSEWKLLSRLDRLEIKYNTQPNLSGHIPQKFECPRVDRNVHLKRFRELALDKIGKDVKGDVLCTIAQHHGLATSLLDFTYSPLVALFFAFEEEKCWCEENSKAIFKEPDKRALFALTHHLSDKGKVDEKKSKHIRDLVKPFSAPGYGNYRAVSQAGLFLKMPQKKYPDKWDLESYIKEKYKDETYNIVSGGGNAHPSLILRKFEINNVKRVECLNFLDQMNINRATLFPDLDGFAKYVNDLWEINFDKAIGYIDQLKN